MGTPSNRTPAMRYTFEDYDEDRDTLATIYLHADSDEAALDASKNIPFAQGALVRLVFRDDSPDEIALIDRA